MELPNVCNKNHTKTGAAIDKDCKTKLFQPLTVKNITFKNRIFLAPMCTYSARDDGKPNSFHLMHYGGIAHRGAALVMIGASAVQKIGRVSPCDLGLWSNDQVAAFKPLLDYIHFSGSYAGIQLAHGGRKSSGACRLLNRVNMATVEEGGWPEDIVGPSPIPFNEEFTTPKELTREQIQEIVKDFGEGARRANEAGFDIVQIHAAHGYLIHQFLSPLSNHRTDEYGGSFENRIRLCLEVIQSVKKQWPEEKPLFIRFSCEDYVEGGWNLEETIKLCRIVKEMGIDFVDCSSGGVSKDQVIPKLVPGYQVPFAKAMKKENPDVLISTVGLILDGKQAEEILQSGAADAICVGRPFLRDPSTVLNWARDTQTEIEWPCQYVRAKPKH